MDPRDQPRGFPAVIESRTGDLFSADHVDALAHGCNCAGAMGRDIRRRVQTSMAADVSSVKLMLTHAAEHGVRSIAIPRIAAGLGGLEWPDVEAVIAPAVAAAQPAGPMTDIPASADANLHHHGPVAMMCACAGRRRPSGTRTPTPPTPATERPHIGPGKQHWWS
ncbi:macro domain-containing protein [Streptomyces sp. NPDC001262]|uniref:macro domain-containing protein n=1 Tax=unclassified Streptomyces TaxID=2593676 RepID=UPI0036A61422